MSVLSFLKGMGDATAAGAKLLVNVPAKAVSGASKLITGNAEKAGPLVVALELLGIGKEVHARITRDKYGYDEAGRIYRNTDYQRVLSDYKMNIMNNYGVKAYKELNYDVNDIIQMAVDQKLVSKEDADLAKDYYNYYRGTDGGDWGLDLNGDGEYFGSAHWRSFKRLLQFGNDKLGTNEEVAAIKRVANACAKVAFPKATNIDEFLENMYDTSTIPTPQYVSTINPDTDKLPVPEAKWYTGQEMADLFDINYDPNHYYDLIKKGTEAAVEAQRYQNEQAIAGSMMDDTIARNQYLQSIDNSKADAVIKGTTLGQRMANELLANANAANEYATNQANVFNQAMTDITKPIQNNAKAGITAADYYNKNVFQPIGTNIEDLYYNDINRIGAIENYNANVHAANQAYNAAAVAANAEMDSAYDYAVGQLNAAKNDYRRVYDTFYNSNDNPYTNDTLRGLYAFNKAQNYFLTNNPNAEMK